MKHRNLRFTTFLIGAICWSCLAFASQLDDTRSLVSEWVKVEETISKEATAWLEKEASLLDLSKVAEVEIASIKEELELIEFSTTEADKERQSLVLSKDELEGLSKRIRDYLSVAEERLTVLEPRLPSPLRRNLEPLFARVPEEPSSSNMGNAERMQTVVTILTSIVSFDDKIHVEQEIRDLGNGTEGEVTTLWIGLGAAYYLDVANDSAGFGTPRKSGWEWIAQPELRNRIEEAIALAEGRTQEARFIPLPVEVSQR